MSLIYLALALFQFHVGAETGGWATDLGSLHYWFAIYSLGDVLASLSR